MDPGLGPNQVELMTALHDMLALMFRETGTIAVVQPKVLERQPPDRLLSLSVSGQNDVATQIRAVLETPADARVVWTGQKGIVTDQCAQHSNAGLMAFCNQILEVTCQAERFVDLAGEHSPVPAGRDLSSSVSFAVSSIFSIRSDRIQNAVVVLEDLVTEQSHPVLYAWLAQAYTIQYVERYKPADAELRERCEEACRAALAGGAQNSNVLAAVANARTNINRNYLAGMQLAEQSIKANPANPLAWWSYSNALQCVGRSELAHRAAKNSQLLADRTSLQFWCDFQVSVTAALLGETEAAIEHGERAVALVPDFRPPLRYLTALYAMEGDSEAMGRTANALKSVELDFSVTQMIEDEDYPIGMMRRYGKNLTRALRNVASESDLD
ncbi:hypothetical protein [uncultured Tateyamaria sp.]|uniref:hypothetical protein n=1 Tax=uncultured Tateyamaria sp. TaxID=455651 RepID=UPI00260A9331|nr:hypothetical protein [uncultured Tateyamaria sp.]